jgi:hypothetical protein
VGRERVRVPTSGSIVGAWDGSRCRSDVTAHVRRNLLAAIPVVLGVSVMAFALLHLLPEDPALVMLGDSGGPPERIAELRAQLGLDDPLVLQYARFLGNLLRSGTGKRAGGRQTRAWARLNETSSFGRNTGWRSRATAAWSCQSSVARPET